MREGCGLPSDFSSALLCEIFMGLSRYCKIYRNPKNNTRVTLFSTKTMAAAEVLLEVIRDIEKGKLPDRERKILTSEGFLVKSEEAERGEMLGFLDELNAEDDTFSPVVVLNLDCNLACRYCFEGTRKGKFYMTVETADRFVDFVKSKDLKGKDEITAVFYGGEPLLSMDIIVRISEKLHAFAKSKKITYSFSFITNGTLLTPRAVEKLKPLGLAGATVTLDGPREVHDAFRPFKTGKGSFETIVNNIRNVCRSIDVQVGGNYTRDRYRKFPLLLDYFLEIGLTPKKISRIRFDPVVSESSPFALPDFHDGCMSLDEPWLAEAGIFLREEILRRGFRTQEITSLFCLIEHRDDVIVNYDGTLYKCPSLIGWKEYSVGNIRTGFTDYRRSHGIDNWKNEKCLACCYLPLCFGGCRYMKLVREGNMRGVDCRKQYFDKALQSLVLQDVRYHNANES